MIIFLVTRYHKRKNEYDLITKKFSKNSILRIGKSSILDAIKESRQTETIIYLYKFYADWYYANHLGSSKMSTTNMESFIRRFSLLFSEVEKKNILTEVSEYFTSQAHQALDSTVSFKRFVAFPQGCSTKTIFRNLNTFKDVFSELALKSEGHHYYPSAIAISKYSEECIEKMQEVIFQAFKEGKLQSALKDSKWVLKNNDNIIGVLDELPGDLEKRITFFSKGKLFNTIECRISEIKAEKKERIILRTFFSEYAQVFDSDYFLTSTAA